MRDEKAPGDARIKACEAVLHRGIELPTQPVNLDIPGLSGNGLSMDQISPLPALTQDEVRVGAWAEVREPLEELQLAPLGRRALVALEPRPGESVLDIGCGGGETALDLAQAIAPDGRVVGVDLSAAVLAFARRAAKGCERVQFVQADAQVFPFEPASFDAAFSRFGVMFFADPTAAFINIRRSLRPNGRLAFVCWRALQENLLDILPLRAASAHLPPQPLPDPDAPGPIAFANPERVRGILQRAGFREIEINARGEQVGSGDLDTMLAVCSRVGALGKILRENPELRAAALPAVRSALAEHDGPDGVVIGQEIDDGAPPSAGEAAPQHLGDIMLERERTVATRRGERHAPTSAMRLDDGLQGVLLDNRDRKERLTAPAVLVVDVAHVPVCITGRTVDQRLI
jgi:SAM-dependent methyltransferase